MISGNDTIEKIRNGDEQALAEAYEAYRPEFIRWAQKQYGCPEEDAKEAYQVSFFVFYDNVLTGKLWEVSSTIKTYLFAIGRNKIFEQHRYNARNLHGMNEEVMRFEILPPDSEEKEEKYKVIEQGMQQLGSPCREILEMVYYAKRSMDYITQELGYKNVATTKNQKYKCMQRLKKIVEGINV